MMKCRDSKRQGNKLLTTHIFITLHLAVLLSLHLVAFLGKVSKILDRVV